MAKEPRRQQPSAPVSRTERRTGGNDETWPRIPAERDESADEHKPGPLTGAPTADDPLRSDMRQAQRDLAEGQIDTDERSRGSDQLMDRLKRNNSRSGEA
jgi:hypothetical protein